MSPEQLKGHAVDQRSDVFSFGAILYEMLSGRRAFHGDSAAETMSAILKEDPPDLSDSNKSVSPALARLVTHCLEKNPEARFHSARDLAFTLEALSGTSNGSNEAATLIAPVREQPKRRERLLWIGIVAALTVAALLFGVKYFRQSAPAQGQAVRFFVFPSDKATLIASSQQISPDGTKLVYVASGADGKRAIWTRRLDSLNAELLPGTEEPANPFWSPDGRSLGFFSGSSKLEKIELSGGPPQVLAGVRELEAVAGTRKELFSSRELSMMGCIVFPPRAAHRFRLQNLMSRGRRRATRGHTSCPTAGIFCFWQGAHKERTPVSTPAVWIRQSESS